VNVAPGVFVPAFIYIEDVPPAGQGARRVRLKGQTRLWGYNAVPSDKSQELTDILIEAENPVRDGSKTEDTSPVEGQRSWLRQAEENIVIVSPARNTMTMVEDRFYADEMLLDIMRHYASNVSLLTVASSADYEELLRGTRENDIFIVATVNAHLDKEQAGVVRFLIADRRRVIGIAVRNPYDLQAFPQLRTFLATYEYTRPALLAAARVIFGECEARGRLPVSLSG